MVAMFYKVFYFLPRPGHVSSPLRVGYRGEGGARFGGWPPGKIDTPGQDFHQRAPFSSKKKGGAGGLAYYLLRRRGASRSATRSACAGDRRTAPQSAEIG